MVFPLRYSMAKAGRRGKELSVITVKLFLAMWSSIRWDSSDRASVGTELSRLSFRFRILNFVQPTKA